MRAVLIRRDKPTNYCPNCDNSACIRVRRNRLERWVSHIVNLKAYRCANCNHRFLSRR